MMFAEVSLTTSEAIGLLTSVVLSLSAAVVFLWRQVNVTAAERLKYVTEQAAERLKDMTEQRDSYKQIAYEATEVAESFGKRKRIADGKPPKKSVPAVVSEHASPPTAKQLETAELATLRQRITTVTEEAGLSPRNGHGAAQDVSTPLQAAGNLEATKAAAVLDRLEDLKDDTTVIKDAVIDKVKDRPEATP